MDDPALERIIEAALLAAGTPLNIEQLQAVFGDTPPDRATLEAALDRLATQLTDRGVELKRVAGGWRLQVPERYAPWVARLWEEKPARYSRAVLETLAIIAYRQPVTRAEIEAVRGVPPSTSVMHTLQERGWIRVAGHRDSPGRPAVFATTRDFLDHFNLSSLSELPTLMDSPEQGK
ncbi:hypothetical protein SPICUR_03430 [Spiribacter curvatus]|uniref:Segregation and condensation protein B n=1 Tax=Spiribacter curvatus TaxID=1335757 RepID=U5T2E1_9GAMM|nr:SMC-Scp complex subunit ScpB [Spiribacter curvatus]AGY91679.1 hypothetical protein SPICUR_03430 [Spiribacter curvatus]